jgi:hypothetical protein
MSLEGGSNADVNCPPSASHDQWFAQFNTNVFGTLNTTRAFLPHMRRNKAGIVVFIGSMVAWDGLPAGGAYCASKAAIHCMSLCNFLLCTWEIDSSNHIQAPQNLFLESLNQLESKLSSLNPVHSALSFSTRPLAAGLYPRLKITEPFQKL